MVIELQCTVSKAFEILTQDPRKCPMTSTMTRGLEASKKDADKDGKPLKWREEVVKGRLSEIFTVEQSFVTKPGKTAHVVRTSKHETREIRTEWEYEIEPAGKGKCRITLEGYTDVMGKDFYVPMVRLMMFMDGSARKAMVGHLNMLADAVGGERKWIA